MAALDAGQVDMLVAVDTQDNLLGAVFGVTLESMADQLLAEALQ